MSAGISVISEATLPVILLLQHSPMLNICSATVFCCLGWL